MTHDFRDSLRRRIESSALLYNVDASVATIEVTREEKFGDLTTNAAMVWGRELKRNPRELAAELLTQWNFPDEFFEEATVAGPSFINLRLKKNTFAEIMHSILESEIPFGHLAKGEHTKKWLIEFVSANPTGPLNIVSARTAAVGDALARIIESQGNLADREFYVNDAGNQVRLFGESVVARIKQEQGEAAEIPEGGYQGNYVIELAKRAMQAGIDTHDTQEVGQWAIEQIVVSQKIILHKYRVDFQNWFHESELHGDDKVNTAFNELKELGYVYEKDGAQWLQSTAHGIDDKDRVIITSAGNPTYVMADIAYHLEKYRRGYDCSVNFLGPDHHGTIARLMAALKMLGIPDGWHEIKLIQQVNLLRNGEAVKMSKRAGEIVTLDDLLEELGDNATAVDVARYFFLQRKVTTPLDFDLDLAKKQSEENPAFYVQYAYARICSILRQPGAEEFLNELWNPTFIALLQESETRTVIRKFMEYPLVLERCVEAVDPNALPTYLTELAATFHKFYHHHRVLGQERELTIARVCLLRAVKNVLADGLGLLGITAPEQM